MELKPPASSSSQLLAIFCSLLAVAFVGMSGAAARATDDSNDGGSSVLAYCNSTEGRALKCGWATADERKAAGADYCDWCGSIWWGEPTLSLPANISTESMAFEEAGHFISLGCDGPVVVRAVLKLTKAPSDPTEYTDKDCAEAFLDGAFEQDGDVLQLTVIRCELQLPNGTEPEEQRAVRGTEDNCYNCTRCSAAGGCPGKLGVWYSDSFTYNATGCASLLAQQQQQQQQGKFSYVMPVLTVNPSTEFELAKFEVCGQPPCFDAAYEAQKEKNAKQCYDMQCPSS